MGETSPLSRLSLLRSSCGWSPSLPCPAGTSPFHFLLLGERPWFPLRMSSLAKPTSLVGLSLSCSNLRMPLTPVGVEGLVGQGASLRGLRRMSFLPFPPWDKALGICFCCLLRNISLCLFSFQARCLFLQTRVPSWNRWLGARASSPSSSGFLQKGPVQKLFSFL